MKSWSFWRAALTSLFVLSVVPAPSAGADQYPATLFGSIPAFSSPTLSPNGKYLAFVTPIDGVYNVIVSEIAVPGNLKRYGFDTSSVLDLKWHGDSRLIATVRAVTPPKGNSDLTDVRLLKYVILPDRSEPPTLMIPISHLTSNGVGDRFLDPGDADHIYMSMLWAREHALFVASRVNLYRVDLAKHNEEVIQQGSENTVRWIMDGVGHVVARIDLSDTHEDRVLVPNGRNFREIAVVNDAKNPGEIVDLTEDGRSLAVLGRRDSDRLGLYPLNLATGKWGDPLFLNKDFDISGVIHDERNSRVIGVTYNDGTLRSFYFSPELQRLQKSVEETFRGRVARIVSTTNDRKKSLIVTSGPQSPPVLQLFDTETSHIDAIAEAYPQLNGARLGIPFRYPYALKNGTMLTGLLTLPPGTPATLPAVVLPASGFGYNDGNFDWFAQFLATHGYVVFQAGTRTVKRIGDVAGMDELGDWIASSQEDLTAGLDGLIERKIIDPKHVCIAGAHEGAYLAFLAAESMPDRFACVISFAGIFDLKSIVRDAEYHAQFALNTFADSLVRNYRQYSDKDLDRYSPAQHANAMRAPVRMIDTDIWHWFAQSETMGNALNRVDKKKDWDYFWLKNEDLTLSRAESRISLLNAVDAFLWDKVGRDYVAQMQKAPKQAASPNAAAGSGAQAK
jgi:dipeptidyl aminopeptidase/acylaminoacyl peptidase